MALLKFLKLLILALYFTLQRLWCAVPLSIPFLRKQWIALIISMASESTHNYSIFKRISSLILLILCVFIAVNLYIMHNQNAAKWYEVESEQLGRSLTTQAAQLVAAPLAKDDQTLLAHYVEVINQGAFVQAAVLFDSSGIRYVEQQQQLTVVELTQNSDVAPLVFVEDIVFEAQIIGYIKLVLNKQEITQHHRSFNQHQISQSILMIVLSIIAAALATRLFYKLRESYRFSNTHDKLN